MVIGCEEVYENGEVKIDCDEHIFKIKKKF